MTQMMSNSYLLMANKKNGQIGKIMILTTGALIRDYQKCKEIWKELNKQEFGTSQVKIYVIFIIKQKN